MHASRRVFTLLACTVAGVLTGVASAHAEPGSVIFNLGNDPLDRPARVFFQADFGPYLDALRWTGWGTEGAVGAGRWILDCSNGGGGPCQPGDGVTSFPARYTLSGLIPCPRLGPTARVYRTGIVEVDRPSGTVTSHLDSPTSPCAKRPTVVAAKLAVKRYLLKHGPARTIRTSCRITGPQDLQCKARWTQRATPRVRGFFVFPLPDGSVGVRPVGT